MPHVIVAHNVFSLGYYQLSLAEGPLGHSFCPVSQVASCNILSCNELCGVLGAGAVLRQ